MAVKIYTALLSLLFISGVMSAAFPDSIEQCSYGDVECIKKVAADVLKKHPNGFAALKVPNVEPFHLDNATFGDTTTKRENFDVKLEMTDFDIFGLSKFVFEKFVGFEKDPSTSKFEFYGRVPDIKIKAKYNIKGKVLGLPIEGEGPLEMNIGNLDVSMKVKVKETDKKDGKSYLKVDKYKTLIDAKSFNVKLDNLFKGDKNLGESMNELLNKNWQVIWTETKPDVNKIVGKFAVDIINDIFTTIPYQDLFKPE